MPLRARHPLPRRKRLLFSFILLALILSAFLMIEAALSVLAAPALLDEDIQTIFPLGRITREQDRFSLDYPNIYHASRDFIPLEKSPNTFRIFCLGESVAAGWPHPLDETYSSYLRRALAQSFPDRRFEVIDCAAPAYPPYLIRVLLHEILPHSPDAVVIFTGNNNFMLEPDYPPEIPAARGTAWALRHSRIFLHLHRLIATSKFLEPAPLPPDEVTALPSNRDIVQQLPRERRTDPARYEQLLAHFRHTLDSMLTACADRDVPAFILTVPVNQADWRPLSSINRLEGGDLDAWFAHIKTARDAFDTSNTRRALVSLEAAVALAPEHAETHFEIARLHRLHNNFPEARLAYQRAVDLDANPYRATTGINNLIRAAAAGNLQATLVEAERAFNGDAPHGLVGEDYFLDNVHPTRRGNLIVAREVFNALARKLSPNPPAFPEIPPTFVDGRAYSEVSDRYLQITIIGVHVMMHQYQHFEQGARRALDLFDRNIGYTRDHRGDEPPRLIAEATLAFALAMQAEHASPTGLFPMLVPSPALLEAYYTLYHLF